jgi:hypothetical protein
MQRTLESVLPVSRPPILCIETIPGGVPCDLLPAYFLAPELTSGFSVRYILSLLPLVHQSPSCWRGLCGETPVFLALGYIHTLECTQ